ncbi:volume-regulated anion channel subunit LRRC8C-like [Ambystoma mexicanum]|uniref:volume-regulated anion channel subunit LRRC8C-like n=1 Tax=Ambystoma mexicanum TaxID=8296 RepID=UPI0037E730C3
MILLTDLTSFSSQNPALRILKPWWDVVSDYLNIVMLMMAVFAASLQVSYEKMICLPVPPGLSPTDNVWNMTALNELIKHERDTGFQTKLDLQYYGLINQWCYDNAILTYSKFFAYLILTNSMIFLISSNFWFKFPGTSSKIEHFISVLGKCLDSPWTTKALSETVYEDTEEYPQQVNTLLITPTSSSPSSSALSVETKVEHGVQPSQAGVPTEEPSVIVKPSKKPAAAVDKTSGKILDKKEGEQAKALFEKVKMFRVHTEEKDILYQMYKRQTFLRALETLVFLCYVAVYTPRMKHIVSCTDSLNITGFRDYYCIHGLWRMYSMISIGYLCVLCIYSCSCSYTLYWISFHKLKEYSFEAIRMESGINDIPDVVNDFAFLLHLIDQYDTLYSWKFAVFLSDVSETKLLQVNLNHYWTTEKLRQCLSINSEGKTELRLSMIPAIPIQVFEVNEIEVLKLEFIRSLTIISAITNLRVLSELRLHNANVKMDTQALAFLKKNLVVLRVHFSSALELPSWMYHMLHLQELYLDGRLQIDKVTIYLHSFRDLKQLKVLYLQLSIGKLPSSILDVAATLTHLTIYNEGTKFHSLASLKKFSHLTHLRLLDCRLERIPSSIFSLTNMKEIELTNNNLTSLEELASCQHLKQLASLKLSENSIVGIPASIEKISNINTLQLNNNLLSSLNTSICNLKQLTHLNVSYNVIAVLPSEIGHLQRLEYFNASHNKISELPKELFACTNLQTLLLSHNKIRTLPPQVGALVQLSALNLVENLLEKLPVELEKCVALNKAQLFVERELFATLPADVRYQLQNKPVNKDVSMKEFVSGKVTLFLLFVNYFFSHNITHNLTFNDVFYAAFISSKDVFEA